MYTIMYMHNSQSTYLPSYIFILYLPELTNNCFLADSIFLVGVLKGLLFILLKWFDIILLFAEKLCKLMVFVVLGDGENPGLCNTIKKKDKIN